MSPSTRSLVIPKAGTVRGHRMAVNNWTAIRSIFTHIEPVLMLFEVIKNSIEAWTPDCGERPMIDIFPNEDRQTVIRDNGRGIVEKLLEAEMGGFGISSKKTGALEGENLGWGASLTLAFLNPINGSLFTTWVRGVSQATQVIIGIDSEGFPGFLPYGPQDLDVHKVPQPVNTPSGTQVILGDFRFDAALIALELSDHFPRFSTKPNIPEALIRIHKSDPAAKGYSETPLEVKPLSRKAIDRVDHTLVDALGIPCRGSFEVPHARVEWYIIGHNTSEISPCYEAWNGEVIQASSRGGAIQRMSAYGVWAGHHRIVLIITRQNTPNERQLVANLFRTEVENWQRAAAQREVSAVINQPDHPLSIFMKWWSEREEEHNPDDSGVKQLLDAWQTPFPKVEGPNGEPTNGTPPGPDKPPRVQKPVSPVDPLGPPSVDPPPIRPKRLRERIPVESRQLKIGRPQAIFSSAADLGSDPVRYIPRANKILINKQVGIVRALLEEAKKLRLVKGTIDRIKAHMIHAVVAFNRETGRLPGQDEGDQSLIMAISCPTAAIEYVRGTRAKPKVRKKKAAKP